MDLPHLFWRIAGVIVLSASSIALDWRVSPIQAAARTELNNEGIQAAAFWLKACYFNPIPAFCPYLLHLSLCMTADDSVDSSRASKRPQKALSRRTPHRTSVDSPKSSRSHMWRASKLPSTSAGLRGHYQAPCQHPCPLRRLDRWHQEAHCMQIPRSVHSTLPKRSSSPQRRSSKRSSCMES